MMSSYGKYLYVALAAALATMLLLTPARAQDEGAVEIEASEMEILETDRLAIFRGDVVARRPSDTIRCQEMTVTYAQAKASDGGESNVVERIDCKGNVSVVTGDQKITGENAKFFLLRDELLVTGNVMLTQGKTVLRGPQLSVDLKTKRARMTGGRVKGKFVPK